ncbi:hypothetical protein BX661DRAFT_174859 [Kickxella alabastrina]|uniref:Uncharacterized protein n=1 Tax=Kickxella alabastrina TaxID=61397 RepID=A0ACC1IAC5_9FUNG|nr:uncharacterized protein BX661DRAFT_189158 [Kickxella alabastrina]XP_051394832.1 uncharacterized protein BX661DRAFT_174859 [Kickxella alabastrina]KAI7820485.1 hypothetical protein BX661DRAFT_189158 [Kickxella alabastrina]KAI7834444.1 hypothetical protein BX661DRAFT_174859 [Kickxella alabastrina]KAJ1891474.1 hypothetical protein LPJ66_006898 [Kickxella alabastrina]
MAPIFTTLVGGTVGLITGMYSMGLRGRTVVKPHLSYAIFTAAGCYIGFKYYEFKQYEGQLIEKRREYLLEKRAQRQAEASS